MKLRRGKAGKTIWVWLCHALAAVCVSCLFLPLLSLAQGVPKAKIDLDCRAFAVASDGRIACAAYHLRKFHHYTIERDDIWIARPDGKRKEIVDGERLVKATRPFSYKIRRLAFSPDGHLLTVQMNTEQVIDAAGHTHEGELVDLMTEEGKEIPVAGTHTSVIEGATQANWLAGNQAVAYLIQAGLLYQIGLTRPQAGKGGPIFQNHYFTAVAWDPAHSSAVAIERDKALSGPIQLVRLDLLHETDTLLATLDGFLGQLTLSPSGDKVGYFRNGDTLAIRSLADPKTVTSVRCAYGHFRWTPDGQRILLKRGPENQSNDIVWVSIPGGNLTPILHDLAFRDFAFLPDGQSILVLQGGTNNLLIYPLR